MTYNSNRQVKAANKAINEGLDQAQETFDQVRDKAGQVASDARSTAQQTLNDVGQRLGFEGNFGDQPWLVVGAGLAVGYLLGNAFGSRRQDYQYDPGQSPASFSYSSYNSFSPDAAMQQAQQYEANQREGVVGKLGRKMFGSLNSLQDLFQDQLQDMYDAEHQILKALPQMIEAASAPELKQAFESHLRQTQGQVGRLEQVFQQLSLKPQGKACAAMQGIIAEGEELLGTRADALVMDAGLIASAQRVEHYEMAVYGCLRTWARQLGYNQAIHLLQQTLDEEEQTDQLLSQIAERTINLKAAER